jgi:hypothetical protein
MKQLTSTNRVGISLELELELLELSCGVKSEAIGLPPPELSAGEWEEAGFLFDGTNHLPVRLWRKVAANRCIQAANPFCYPYILLLKNGI